MLDFKEKKKIKNVIYSGISFVVVIILLFIVIKGVYGVYKDERLTKNNRNIALQELIELQERKNNIAFEVDELNTLEGIEKEIRDKFRVVKEGEKMVMIVDSDDKNNSSIDNKDENIFIKILNFFKKQ